MGLNDTPSGERIAIGFFGMRNAGKSSVTNAVTNQQMSVVSPTLGTTTDPVRKTMELLPLGPVVIIDTPGIDDEGELGEARVQRAREVLRGCHAAVLVVDAAAGMRAPDLELLGLFASQQIPCVIAANKWDLLPSEASKEQWAAANGAPAAGVVVPMSAAEGWGARELREAIAASAKETGNRRVLIADLIAPGDTVVLVIPIDGSAPKGRIILPQQMVLREALDVHARCVACQPEELAQTLEALREPPRLVVTDSQVFGKVAGIVPESVALTSFSILMARYKGDLRQLMGGVAALDALKDGDTVLVSEGCTHHRQCQDIGTVKIPGWIRAHTGAEPRFMFTSGGEFPEDLDGVSLVVHCGGCMLNEKEMKARMGKAAELGVPMLNYGVAIAHMHGILCRSLAPLGV